MTETHEERMERHIETLAKDLAGADIEIKRLTNENDYLRVLAQKGGCAYNNMNENGSCKSGYPGCACMDDIMHMYDQPESVEKLPVAQQESAFRTIQPIEPWKYNDYELCGFYSNYGIIVAYIVIICLVVLFINTAYMVKP